MPRQRQVAVGAILTEVLQIYRAHAGPLLSLAAMVFLPLTLVTEIVSRESIGAGMAFSLAFSGSAAFLYCAIVAPLALSQPLIAALQRKDEEAPNEAVVDGPRLAPIAPGEVSIGRLWAEASPGFIPLLMAGLIYTVATTAGVMLLIVPGLILITIWAVAAPIIRFEGASAGAALARSRELVKGYGWQVFALVICVVLIVLAGSVLLQALAIGLAGEETGTFIGSWLGVVIAAPMFGLMPTVLYGRLRSA